MIFAGKPAEPPGAVREERVRAGIAGGDVSPPAEKQLLTNGVFAVSGFSGDAPDLAPCNPKVCKIAVTKLAQLGISRAEHPAAHHFFGELPKPRAKLAVEPVAPCQSQCVCHICLIHVWLRAPNMGRMLRLHNAWLCNAAMQHKHKPNVMISVMYASLAGELGVTTGQWKSWHLDLLAPGSSAALAQSKAEAAELVQLRRDNKRLKEEHEVMRKTSALFAR